jgi:hypothetical protein
MPGAQCPHGGAAVTATAATGSAIAHRHDGAVHAWMICPIRRRTMRPRCEPWCD